MKSLCFSLGMLLLLACCCDAMPQAVQHTAPVNCCYRFSTIKVSQKSISDIKRTHSSCMKKGFILTTVKGRSICYSQSTEWAQKTYNRINSPEGSSLQ